MKVRLITTKGFALQAEIEVDGQRLRVMDQISLPDSPCQPGVLSDIKLTVGDLYLGSWQEAFSGNPEHKKQLQPLHGWDYLGYGQIVSVDPVQIDFGLVQLPASPFTHDARCVGEFVVVHIERLEMSREN